VDDYISRSSYPETESSYVYSDSEHTAAENFAGSMSISGSYGAFSGAASMSVSKSSNSNIKTVRLDKITKAIQYRVITKNSFRNFPQWFLTANFNESVNALTVEQLEKEVGVFYARKLDLGGEVRKSYTMQATATDNESSVKADIQASYNAGLTKVNAEASFGMSKRTSNKNAEMKTEWSAKGGDTTIWLKSSASSSLQEEWGDSITSENMYPFDFKLGYMWELVKAVNVQKGNEFEQHLKKKWDANKNLFKPTTFLG
jgi:hypothetical protein